MDNTNHKNHIGLKYNYKNYAKTSIKVNKTVPKYLQKYLIEKERCFPHRKITLEMFWLHMYVNLVIHTATTTHIHLHEMRAL